MPDKEMTFPITYSVTFHSPPVKVADIPEGHGACGAIFIGAYGEDPDTGEVSVSFHGREADGTELEPLQMFQTWLLLTRQLADTLPEGGPKELCLAVQTTTARAIKMAEEEEKAKNGQPSSDKND